MTDMTSRDYVAEQWEYGPVFAVAAPGRVVPDDAITVLLPGQKPIRNIAPLVVAVIATLVAWAGFGWLLVTALGGALVAEMFIACGAMLLVATVMVWHLSRRAKALLRQRRAAILLRTSSLRAGLVVGLFVGFAIWLSEHPTFWNDVRSGWDSPDVAVPFLMLAAVVGWVTVGSVISLIRLPGALRHALSEQALIARLRAGGEPRGGALRVDQTCQRWIRGDPHIHGSVSTDPPHSRTISATVRSSSSRVPVNGTRVRVYTDGVSHYVELDPVHPPQFAPDAQYEEPQG